MPELPEVETVRKTLYNLVQGKTINDIEIFWPKMIKHPDDMDQFIHLLQGQTISSIERRGKFLKFILNDYVLVSHLRMEGKYVFFKDHPEENKHTHVIFHFTDGTELHYRDVRKFGTMHLFEKGEEEKELPLSQLGVEPFSKEFTVDYLSKKLAKTKRKVKVALLDQTILVGLGNIYVDEALFRAQIHPERVADTLSKQEIVKLQKAIKETLKEAVELGGSTIRSYVNGQGDMGMFQQRLFVYGRNEEPCKECGQEISKIVVGGRGTHFCKQCQRQ